MGSNTPRATDPSGNNGDGACCYDFTAPAVVQKVVSHFQVTLCSVNFTPVDDPKAAKSRARARARASGGGEGFDKIKKKAWMSLEQTVDQVRGAIIKHKPQWEWTGESSCLLPSFAACRVLIQLNRFC